MLLSISVTGFDVTVRLRRELGEEDEARMPGVLSLTLGDRIEASVQVDQLLNRPLPEHLLLVPYLDLPELRQSFRGYVVRLGPLLYLCIIPEHIESNVDLQRSLRKHPQIRLFPDRPRFVGYRECARVPRRKFSSVVEQLQKKARSPLHNVGLILRSDHFWVCRVSAMMITLSLTSMF